MEPHPVRDALDQAAGARVEGVVLVAVDHLVRQDAEDLVVFAVRGDLVDVVEREVDLLVVVVEGGACRVGHAGHGAQYQRHGAGGGDGGGGRGRRQVEVCQDGLDGCLQGGGGVDGCEEGEGAGVVEVADLEAEGWEGEDGLLGRVRFG